MQMDWIQAIQAEFDTAQRARARGNEGQARVCARRAAGIAAREFFARRGSPVRSASAYDVLKLVEEDSSIAFELRRSASYLTLRVDEQFKLPAGIDLIAVSRTFCDRLLAAGGPASKE